MHRSVLYLQNENLLVTENRIEIAASVLILAIFPQTFAGHDMTDDMTKLKVVDALCPARELVADRDKPAAGSVRAREISPALRALLMAKKPQCPSVFRLCEYSSLHVLLSDCCFKAFALQLRRFHLKKFIMRWFS